MMVIYGEDRQQFEEAAEKKHKVTQSSDSHENTQKKPQCCLLCCWSIRGSAVWADMSRGAEGYDDSVSSRRSSSCVLMEAAANREPASD